MDALPGLDETDMEVVGPAVLFHGFVVCHDGPHTPTLECRVRSDNTMTLAVLSPHGVPMAAVVVQRDRWEHFARMVFDAWPR